MNFLSRQHYTFAFWLWAVFIVLLMLRPVDGYPTINIPGLDKIVHLVLFGTLGFLFIEKQKSPKQAFKSYFKKPDFYLLLASSCSIEFMHLFVSSRSFELWDMAANGLGVISGLILRKLGFRFSVLILFM